MNIHYFRIYARAERFARAQRVPEVSECGDARVHTTLAISRKSSCFA